ncbi:hypothetical protein GALMADRAFT_1352513 [Galerina marginata CBS 339.88]|uniref:DNA 3'-5' helicase n=1 Tax=Galerina marginata (strain CBS 339.88) TaxID=685588 RepID=A0A067SP99_GALM3|nr:hypothetical protein GALMADRAFT_1352513 [Galerina marginata CBS 339.88]
MPPHHSTVHAGMPVPKFNTLPSISAQQLNRGPHKTLFEVFGPSLQHDTNITIPVIEHLRAARDNLVPEYFFKDTEARGLSSWMKYTNWHTHVEPYHCSHLIAQAAVPGKSEPALLKLATAVTAIWCTGYKNIETTNIIVLQKLKSDDMDGKVAEKPFQKLQEGSSRDQYEATLVRLLALLTREQDVYTLDLPEKIQKVIRALQTALNEEPTDPANIQRITQNLLLCIWGRTWKKTELNTIGDPTICHLALAMLKHDGSFQSPKNSTTHMSRLKYCLRLVMLNAIKHRAMLEDIEDLQACAMFESWFTEKVDSTFNTLCTLQKYASNLARKEPGLPNVIWMDRIHHQTMRFKGHTIQFDHLTTMFSNMEDHAITIWEKEVLMGLPLRANYIQITDDMGNNDVGYSLFSDPRNTIFKDRDILIKAILADPVLSQRFLTGSKDKHGQPIWNVLELQKWLYSYSVFHGAQITTTDTKGGAPSRGTEMECIQYMNTKTRLRGLYMMGNHLAILCQYHKTAAIMGVDKLIPHSLDAVTSDLVIQDLAIARPFAELAAYICYPHDFSVQHKYHSYLFINNKELFDTPHLTRLLKSYTLPVFEVGFGVADWRHISAAFRRKIAPSMDLLIEEDDSQESVQALQSGHSRHTDNQLYGISPEALAGLSEDVLPLFLDASTDWQVACKVVPGGHLLSYSEARVASFATLAAGQKIKANYTTPVKTMEQVMDRVMLTLDTCLEKQTNSLLTHIDKTLEERISTRVTDMFEANIDKKLEDRIVTRVTNMFEAKINQMMDQIGHTFTSKYNASNNNPTGSSSIIKDPQSGQSDKRWSETQSDQSDNRWSDSIDTLVSPPTTLQDTFNNDSSDQDMYFDSSITNEDIGSVVYQTQVITSHNNSQVMTSQDNIGQALVATKRAEHFSNEVESNKGSQRPIDPSCSHDMETAYEVENRALALLRKHTKKPEAQWTSKLQWQAIYQVYLHEQDVIAITATGSGKTMIAMLPTLLGEDNELALILLPLNSLITDYKRKFTAMGIPFDVYCPHTPNIHPYAKFLLISADVTMAAKWPAYLAKLTDRFSVLRLIFDESQIPMISTDYRKVMSLLDQLRLIPMQIVLLTGTCPPSYEPRMMEIFGLQSPSTVIIRGRTDRPELQYIRRKTCTTVKKALQELDPIVENYKRLANASARAMVFVPYLTTGSSAAKHLECDFYHSQHDDDGPGHNNYLKHLKEKEETYNNWYNGRKANGTQSDIIVATTALSAGNDYPSVRLVVHFNTPTDMISYVQEVSRGGRDGQPTQCILIPINTNAPSQKTPGKDYKGQLEMHQYVFKEETCLRYAITSFCDGVVDKSALCVLGNPYHILATNLFSLQ